MSQGKLSLFAPAKVVSGSGRATGARAGTGPYAPTATGGHTGTRTGPRIWTVTEVADTLRGLLKESFGSLWVTGEVSGFSRSRSGHGYFTLKDRAATLSCALFSREAARLPALPEDGMKVRVFGRMDFYGARGECQLVVKTVETESGEGMWKVAFDRLHARLKAEGLTDPARKRPLPPFPVCVGVVTSRTGAALRDVVSVLGRRSPWVRLLLRDTRVQGAGAANEVAAAVALLARSGTDVIIVARGGGSAEDLWAFNEEAVARAVAASPVPVVSGVGHETDLTICDLVADLRAATPSAAAEAVAPERRALDRRLEQSAQGLGRGLRSAVRSRRWRLDRSRDELFRAVGRLVPARVRRLEAARKRLGESAMARIGRNRGALARMAAEMHALSPLQTLGRGYAVPLDRQGGLLRTRVDFVPGRRFRLRVQDGEVPCRVRGAGGGARSPESSESPESPESPRLPNGQAEKSEGHETQP